MRIDACCVDRDLEGERAQVKPGNVITPENATKVQNLVCRRESLRPVLEKGDDGFQELEICSRNRGRGFVFHERRCRSERGR